MKRHLLLMLAGRIETWSLCSGQEFETKCWSLALSSFIHKLGPAYNRHAEDGSLDFWILFHEWGLCTLKKTWMSLSKLRELVIEREAWRAVIHGVAKSQTWLSDWTELNWIIPQGFAVRFSFFELFFLCITAYLLVIAYPSFQSQCKLL